MNRDQLLALAPASPSRLPRSEVSLPGGAVVHVRQLTAGEFDRLQLLSQRHRASVGGNVLLATFAVCDAEGARLLGDDDFSGMAALPAPVVLTIASAANQLNSFDDDAFEAERGN